MRSISLVLCTLLTFANCLAIRAILPDGDEPGNSGVLGLLGLAGGPGPLNASSAPDVSMPSIAQSPLPVTVERSAVAQPESIEGQYVPIGPTYDVKIDTTRVSGLEGINIRTVIFKEPVELTYTYDLDALSAGGMIEDFEGYVYDEEKSEWVPVHDVRVDLENRKVTLLTTHFSTFILTALPAPTGTGAALPPACINNEAPITVTGSSGTLGPRWTVIGPNFKYLIDRNRTIRNTADFRTLNLEGALGLATCEGRGSGVPCGTPAEHRRNTSSEYLRFTAPKAIDVYLMYDSRGPTDPTWLTDITQGWVLLPEQIRVSNRPRFFKVYRKYFPANATVVLPGNRHGISGATNIDTNYWLAIKPAGMFGASNASEICASTTAADAIPPIENLHAIPGSNKVTIFWKNPDDTRVTNVVVRRQRNFPAMLPWQGQPPAPSAAITQNHILQDTGVVEGRTYYYSVFALDASATSQDYSPVRIIEATTGADSEPTPDGIKDAYEVNPLHTYQSGNGTSATSSDTDGDGFDDLDEIIAGTDPTNPDTTLPGISFVLNGPTTTTFPIIGFALTDPTNDATEWLVKEDPNPPHPHDARWTTTAPSSWSYATIGTKNLYAWARDAAGNLSPMANISLNLTGIAYPEYTYVVGGDNDRILIYRFNLATARLEYVRDYGLEGGRKPFRMFMHPNHRFLYITSFPPQTGMTVLRIEPDGSLTHIEYEPFGNNMWPTIAPDGRTLYASGNPTGTVGDAIAVYSINPGGDLSLRSVTPLGLSYSSWPLLDAANGRIHVGGLDGFDTRIGKVFSASVGPDGSLQGGSVALGHRLGDYYPQAVHPAGNYAYTIEGILGLAAGNVISSIPIPGGSTHLRARAFHPSGGFLYFGYANLGATPVSGGIQVLSVISGGATVTTVQTWPLPFDPMAVEVDATGNMLFVSGPGNIATFRIDAATGAITLLQVSPQSSPQNTFVATRVVSSTNMAPAVSVALRDPVSLYRGGASFDHFTRWAFTRPECCLASERVCVEDAKGQKVCGCREGDQEVFCPIYVRISSFDPDAGRCSADPLGVGTVSFPVQPSSKPPTTDPSNQWFRPRFWGDHVLRYSVADDAGSCSGGSRSTTVEHAFTVAERVDSPWHFVDPKGFQKPHIDSHTQVEIERSPGSTTLRPLPQVYERLTCELSWMTCVPRDGGLRLECTNHTKQAVRTGPIGETCTALLDPGHLWDYVFLTKRLRVVSREPMWRGRTVRFTDHR